MARTISEPSVNNQSGSRHSTASQPGISRTPLGKTQSHEIISENARLAGVSSQLS
jgi:hypothetical protein